MNPLNFTIRSFLLLNFLLSFTWLQVLQSQTVKWKGGAAIDPSGWAVGANWDGGMVPALSNDVVIPATANHPVLRTGTNAEAKSLTIEQNASMLLENNSVITIKGAAVYGIDNRGAVENGGTINIDNTASHGLFNGSGSAFTNSAILNVGQLEGNIQGVGVYNTSVFSNEGDGNISIDNTSSDGINNTGNASFTNDATLHIGNNGGVNRYGINNAKSFTNAGNGLIHIDNVNVDGIRNTSSGSFSNGGNISIGQNGGNITRYGISNALLFENTGQINIENTGSYGLNNLGDFSNTVAGNMSMGNTGSFALYNSPAGTFTNESVLYIGQSLSNIDGVGIYNENELLNRGNGEIRIDNTTSHAIFQFSGHFINEASINIGLNGGNIAGLGIRNTSVFENKNNANLTIGNTADVAIFNTSAFSNSSNAVISVDETGSDAIRNISGTFTNAATIYIGQNGGVDNIGQYAIWNLAVFNNNGTMIMDNTKVDGMYNFGGAEFNNAGPLYIGQTAGNIKGSGILNYGTFSNSGSGHVKIDNVILDGIYNVNGSSFTNTAAISIGQTAGNIADYGIWNQASSFNNNDGTISIAHTGLSGLRNLTGATFQNQAVLNITNTALSAIFNDDGIFENAGTVNLGQGAGIDNIRDNGIYNASLITNTGNGTINIDNTEDFAVYNFTGGTFTNEANLNIGKLEGNINSYGIYNLATVKNQNGGIINVDNTANHAIYHLSGNFTNEASIHVGQNGGNITGLGIRNTAVFENKNSANLTISNTSDVGIANFSSFNNTSNASINIDDVASDAIRNISGTFNNAATIHFGQNGGVDNIGQYAIWNLAIFNNSGALNIDNTKVDGMYNFGGAVFNNTGPLNIGQTAGNIKGSGILNYGTFGNGGAGHIKVDNVILDGIYNVNGSSFTNTAAISIGQAAGNIADYGIWNQASSFNNNDGTISIAHTGLSGVRNLSGATFENLATLNVTSTTLSAIFNDGGTFENEGTVNLGQGAGINNIKDNGIYNASLFTNTGNGTINIDNTEDFAVYNFTGGTFTNEGSLNIGQLDGNIAATGIYNIANFMNAAGGNVKIDNTSGSGINNVGGVFTNEALLSIGKFQGNISGRGIRNAAVFENKNNGFLSIGNTTNSGIYNKSDFSNTTNGIINLDGIGTDAIFNNGGVFTNSAIINIGQNDGEDNIGQYAIWNRADFLNEGTLNIDNTVVDGMYNTDGGNFINSAALYIGQNDGNVKGSGILNYAVFSNSGNGNIRIDRVLLDGIYNVSNSSFTNNANIHIGMNGGSVNEYGIWNKGAQFSHESGSINIANTGLSGVRNRSGGTFTNSSVLNISNAGVFGLWNEAVFTNNTCATINLLDRYVNSSSGNFANAGLLFINSNEAHDNQGTFTNSGILEYAQLNPVPLVVNQEIIISPTIAYNCEIISPAFGLNIPLDFDILGVFNDVSASVPAGDFNQNTNKFTPSAALSPGVYNLFVKIDEGSCVRILPWELTVQSCCTAQLSISGVVQAPLCPGGSDGSISTAVNAGQAPYEYSWSNNGNSASLSSLMSGTYSLTVTDANGCSDVAQFTVPQGVDQIAPTISCPPDITECGAQPISWPVPVVSDNCGIAPGSVVSYPASGSFFDVGQTIVACTATDINGNSNSCFFTVTITAPDVSIISGALPFGCYGLGMLKANVLNPGSLTPPFNFNWSNGTTGQLATIVSNGTYTVTVSDGSGCSTVKSFTTNMNPYTTLSYYLMVSTEDAELKHSTVNGGLGVTDEDEEAKIEENSAINGFVKAEEIDLDNSTINGGSSYPYPNNPPYGPANLNFPLFKTNHLTTGASLDLIIEENQTVVISSPDSIYKKIELKEGATLVVHSSIAGLYAREIKTKEDASIYFQGATSVRVQKNVELYKRNTVAPSGPYSVTFWVGEEFKIQEGASFTANVYALEGVESKGKSNAQNLMAGLFISGEKIKSEYATWNPNPYCSMSSGGNQNLLPVANDFLGLIASKSEHQVKLLWVTNTEYKNSHFVVERSSDGVDFEELYEVERKYGGSQLKQYFDYDGHPTLGSNFYRIKVIFEDGNAMYSEVVRIDFYMDLGKLNLWPNPASEQVNLMLKELAGKRAVVQIFNNLGLPMYQQEFDALPDGPISIELNNFKAGMYHITLQVEGHRMRTRSFVVEKNE